MGKVMFSALSLDKLEAIKQLLGVSLDNEG